MEPKFLGIDHLGVVVSDLEAASTTYEQILGFELTAREELEDRGLSVQFVETGGGRIELISPTRDDSEVSRFLQTRGEGLHHICIRVADLAAALTYMKEKGARLIDETPRPGANSTRVAFIHPKAAHGLLIELVESGEIQ